MLTWHHLPLLEGSVSPEAQHTGFGSHWHLIDGGKVILVHRRASYGYSQSKGVVVAYEPTAELGRQHLVGLTGVYTHGAVSHHNM